MKELEDIIVELKNAASQERIDKMAHFAITAEKAFGVSSPDIRRIAKPYRKNHSLALALWDYGYLETRIMAAFVDDPKQVTEEQMESWVKDLDNWAVCDGLMGELFEKTPFATAKIHEWAAREEEFVRRSAFTMIAVIAVHQKKLPDDYFTDLFPLLEQYSFDNRNFVKKAVNWALRSIGKRNGSLFIKAIELAERIKQQPHPSARWIAADALREFNKRL